MRYTIVFSPPGERYFTSTAVLNAEIMKFFISLAACFYFDCGGSTKEFQELVQKELIDNKIDWLKLTVPSLLYTVQNSLQYVSMALLSAPVFQVLYQMKIITTALFSVLLLAKRITGFQWFSVVALAAGVSLVQLSQLDDNADNKSNSLAGLISVLLSCLTSGFAGVYFEMVLKSSNASIWLRNIQLSLIGGFLSLVSYC
jgi:drug/metabolite transporter (DMT)-like permease